MGGKYKIDVWSVDEARNIVHVQDAFAQACCPHVRVPTWLHFEFSTQPTDKALTGKQEEYDERFEN